MRELSLFTGAGGGLLGTHLLGWRPVGYVEFNDYCQRVIRARIDDGILPNAPIFGDIRTFISEGYAASYQGMVDVITAGFPCQPFSVAGKQRGADDERNMWPATIDAIRIIRPRYCLLENVAALIANPYFGTILGDLAKGGYCVRWRRLSAAEVGAPHQRDRLWICAYAEGERTRGISVRSRGSQQTSTDIDGVGEDVADAGGSRHSPQKQGRQSKQGVCVADSQHASDADHARLAEWERGTEERRPCPTADRCSWWAVEPDLGRVANRMAYRVDRLKSIGNGQVPAVVAAAWHLLIDGVQSDVHD